MPSPWAAPDTRKGPQIYTKSKLPYCLHTFELLQVFYSHIFLPVFAFKVNVLVTVLCLCRLCVCNDCRGARKNLRSVCSLSGFEITFYKQCPFSSSSLHNLLTCF